MKKFLVALLIAGSMGVHGQVKVSVVSKPSTVKANSFYMGNKTPLLPLYFIKLPVGSVQPDGWVKEYLVRQRDGLTGQLGDISAWLEKENNAWYSGNGKGDHGWEEVPYWLKGYGNLGYILQDKAMIAETKVWIEKVFQSQEPSGYFGPKIIPDEKKISRTLFPISGRT